MSLPRKIFLLTCFLFCLNGVLAQKIVKAKKVQVSNGLVYYKKSENPFTGTVTGDYLAIYGAFLNTESSKPGMVEFFQCISLFYKYSDLEMFKDSEFSFKEGKLDGLSKIWAGNSISELNFNDGKLDGLITILDKEGIQKYESTYVNGNKNGLCKEWFSNGIQNFEGSYKDGEKEGLHIYWDENGDWTSIIDYVDGELNYIKKDDLSQEIIDLLPTKVSDIYAKGGKMFYVGTSILFSGIFQKLDYDGKLDYECTYENGYKNGLYKQWHSNGNQKFEYSYNNGEKNGLYKEWHSNGNQKFEYSYNNGKKDGLYKQWHSNGNQKFEYSYEKGEKDGLCKEWHSNGNQKFEGIYKDGEKEGLHIGWGENGDWNSIKDYVDGELNYIKKGDLSQEIIDLLPTKVSDIYEKGGKMFYVGTSILFSGIFQKFDYDGKLDYEWTYDNGDKNGLYKQWHSNGNQKFEYSYNNGEKNGLYKEWHLNGNQKFECSYKDGEKDGLCMEWNAEGVMNLHKYLNGSKTPILKDDLNPELLNILNIPIDVNFSDLKKIEEIYCYEAIESIAFTGMIKEYYPNGKLKLEFNFLDGDFIFQKWYYANGYLAELADYKMREFKVYHKNGKLRYDSENKVTEDHNAGIDKDVYSTYINSNRIKGWHKGYHENEKIHKQFKIIESYSGYQTFNKDSLYKEWHSNGVLSKKCNFINGLLEGEFTEWYKNGKLKTQASYTNAEKEGLYKEWYENGRLSTQTSYVNGEKEGGYKEWHESGRLRIQTSYTNGTLEGSYKYWNSDGRLYEDTKYRSGVKY